MAKTRAQENRAIRQEELRAKLAAGGHLQQVVKNIKKIDGLNVKTKTFKNSLDKIKASTDYQLKLINKYLPDLRATEITGEAGEAIQITEVTRTIISNDKAKH